MKTIPSFTIDHLHLLRGVYVSRKDLVGQETVTTFDIRMKEPNRESVLDQGAIHTLEHLIATYLRNVPEWEERVLYWGPMGCLTGNYLLLRGDLTPMNIAPLLRDAFAFVASYEGDIPGVTAMDCGNYKLHNLDQAKREAQIFLTEVLAHLSETNTVYPQRKE